MHFKKYSEHTSAEIVSFSRVMSVAFVIIALIACWLNDWELAQSVLVLVAVGAAFFVIGMVAPAVLRPFNHVWMSFAYVMNFIMTRVILSFVFFVVMAPISVIIRLTGKSFVVDSKNRHSYWAQYDNQAPAEHFEHLYTLSEVKMPPAARTD